MIIKNIQISDDFFIVMTIMIFLKQNVYRHATDFTEHRRTFVPMRYAFFVHFTFLIILFLNFVQI